MASTVGYLVRVRPDRDSLSHDGYDLDGVPASRVQLTRAALEAVGGHVYRPGQDWKCTLEIYVVGPDGTETPVTWPDTLAAQLRVTDSETGELILTRSTPTELAEVSGGKLQIVFAAADGPYDPGVHRMEILFSASSFKEPIIIGLFEVGRLRVTGGDDFPAGA